MDKQTTILLDMHRILECIHILEPESCVAIANYTGLRPATVRNRIRRLNDTSCLPSVGWGRDDNGKGAWRSELKDPAVQDRNHHHVYAVREGCGDKNDRQVAIAAVSQPEAVPTMLNRMDEARSDELRPGVSRAVRELASTPNGRTVLSKWRSGDDPATPEQIKYITWLAQSRGAAVPMVHTKWEAHLAIDALKMNEEAAA